MIEINYKNGTNIFFKILLIFHDRIYLSKKNILFHTFWEKTKEEILSHLYIYYYI